jgi:hypothetical protein
VIACTGIHAADLDRVWPIVSDLLEPAIAVAERNEGKREDVLAALRSGAKQLYVGVDDHSNRMALVTAIEDRPAGRVCYLAYLAGRNLRAFMPLQPKFVAWAKALGCVALESSSPRAMQKFMTEWKLIGRDGDLCRLRLEI